MGKRSREKRMAETAGRRRQMIQLDGVTRRSAISSDDNLGNQQSLRATKVSGIGLLGAYQEDSDDSGNQSPVSGPTMHQMAQSSETKSEGKMEDELAGFLAEINAIGEQPTTTVNKEEAVPVADVYDPSNFDPYTQGHLLPEPWQAVYDESSGYHYFWNCDTNEVQWIPPPAPLKQEPSSLPAPPPPPSLPDPEVLPLAISQDDETSNLSAPGEESQTANTETAEEEKRKKELSAKLAGLSKKERIKLLLQKNNLSTESASVSTGLVSVASEPVNDATMQVDDVAENDRLELVNSETVNEKQEEKPLNEVQERVTPLKEDTSVFISDKKEEQKPVSGLVAGYDSDLSDSADDNEADTKPDGVSQEASSVSTGIEVDEKIKTDAEQSASLDIDRSSLDSETEAPPEKVEEKQALASKPIYEGLDRVVLEAGECLSEKCVDKDVAKVSDDVQSMEVESGKGDKEEEIEEFIVKDSVEESEEMFEVIDGLTTDDQPSPTDEGDAHEGDSKATEAVEETSGKEGGDAKQSSMDEGKDKDSDVSKSDGLVGEKKETFSVDIFADESGNEDDSKNGTETKGDDRREKETSRKQISAIEDKTVDSSSEKTKEKEMKTLEKKSTDADTETDQSEEKRRSKHKVRSKEKSKEQRSKDKKKRKDQKDDKDHKDRKDRKDRKDLKDPKDLKGPKDKEKTRSKEHKENRRDSSEKRRQKERSDKRERSSRRKSEEKTKEKTSSKTDKFESKDEDLLSIEELLKQEEQKKREIEEEVEREERRRNEFEKLKREELIKEKERKEEEKKKEEEKIKENAKKKEDADNEMRDFAEMLLEGALETEADEPAVESNKNEAGDDMDISDNETEDAIIDDRPPLPPMPPPDEKIPYPSEEPYDGDEQGYSRFDDEEARLRIADLSHLIFDKLAFLEVSRKGLTNFQVMLIEIETRMNDWREGALDSDYLLYRLEEVDSQICKYEETAAPEGWSCHWSSEHGMYYYYNEKSGESSWSYPTTSSSVRQSSAVYGPAAKTSASLETKPVAGPLENYGYGRTDMMMWRSDLVENRVPASTKTPAALAKKEEGSAASRDPYRDPYRQLTGSKEDSRPPSPDERVFSPALPSSDIGAIGPIPPPPGEEDETSLPPNPWDDGTRSGSSSPVYLGIGESTLSANKAVTQSAVASSVPASVPNADSSNTTIVKAAAKLTATMQSSNELMVYHAQGLPASGSTPSAVSTLATKAEKKKKSKRKTLATSGIPSKKLKNVSSLVQKWQQVKQKTVEEMHEASSEDEDAGVVAQKRIEEWKRSQLQSGKAAYNPNFQEIKGDWRERLKKK